MDLTTLVVAYVLLWWLVIAYAAQCTRQLALAVLGWLRAQGY